MEKVRVKRIRGDVFDTAVHDWMLDRAMPETVHDFFDSCSIGISGAVLMYLCLGTRGYIVHLTHYLFIV